MAGMQNITEGTAKFVKLWKGTKKLLPNGPMHEGTRYDLVGTTYYLEGTREKNVQLFSCMSPPELRTRETLGQVYGSTIVKHISYAKT